MTPIIDYKPDLDQVNRASRNAETAVYWAAVVVIVFAVLLGWVTP